MRIKWLRYNKWQWFASSLQLFDSLMHFNVSLLGFSSKYIHIWLNDGREHIQRIFMSFVSVQSSTGNTSIHQQYFHLTIFHFKFNFRQCYFRWQKHITIISMLNFMWCEENFCQINERHFPILAFEEANNILHSLKIILKASHSHTLPRILCAITFIGDIRH